MWGTPAAAWVALLAFVVLGVNMAFWWLDPQAIPPVGALAPKKRYALLTAYLGAVGVPTQYHKAFRSMQAYAQRHHVALIYWSDADVRMPGTCAHSFRDQLSGQGRYMARYYMYKVRSIVGAPRGGRDADRSPSATAAIMMW